MEEVFDYFLTFADVLTHDVTAGDAEEGRLGHFVSAGLGDEGLACARGTVEQDTFPGFTCALKYLWESERHDDCFFEGLFGFE